MGLKIAYLLLIGSPLTGVIVAFINPMFFTGMSLSQDHFKEGLNLHKQGELEKAIREYDQAIRLKPDFAVAYVKLGEASWGISLKRCGITTRDYQSYKAAMAQAHFGRAVIYEAQGYGLKAKVEATRAMELGYDPILIDATIRRPSP